MESKRMVAMLVVMMLVMGNLLHETEAKGFKICYKGCITMCIASGKGAKKGLCPLTCVKKCMRPNYYEAMNQNENEQIDYFCNLGCAAEQCVSPSTIDDSDHVDKVSGCVDSCSNMCPGKN
ncbi:unnamed protein product [Cochlearia groenlandica]